MFAHFINPDDGPAVIDRYCATYRRSNLYGQPVPAVCAFVVCAETDEEAERQASTLRCWMVKIGQGDDDARIPTIEQAERFIPTEWEKRRMDEDRKRIIVGNPKKVRHGLKQLAARYRTDEIMIITNIHDFDAKIRSFQLIAEVFDSSSGGRA